MKGSVFALLLFFAANLISCAKPDLSKSETTENSVSESSADGGIIGGVSVADSDPIAGTVVAIYDTELKSLCTGSILSDKFVVTAGHCFNKNPSKLVLIFGTQLPTAKGPKPVLRRVTDGRVNARYLQVDAMLEKSPQTSPDSIKDWGDISILKFEGGLPKGYSPAQLLTQTSALKNGATVTLAGYGEIDGKNQTPSPDLRKVNVIIANAKFSSTEVQLDQRSGRGACHGDSGGPAYIQVNGKRLLFGVTSRGSYDKNNDCSQFSVFTNLVAQSAWLKTQIQALSLSPSQSSTTLAKN